eukprot:3791864-Rhodomonas_salina.1
MCCYALFVPAGLRATRRGASSLPDLWPIASIFLVVVHPRVSTGHRVADAYCMAVGASDAISCT